MGFFAVLVVLRLVVVAFTAFTTGSSLAISGAGVTVTCATGSGILTTVGSGSTALATTVAGADASKIISSVSS